MKGQSFLEEIVDFSKGGLASQEEATTFVQKCEVHFKRSLTRVLRNGRVVPTQEGQEEFRYLVNVLLKESTTPNEFMRACNMVASRFPNAAPWLAWHLSPNRAMSFFPACRRNKDSMVEKIRQSKLQRSTNAQENIGKQFQELFMRGRKMLLNETVLNAWKFCSGFQRDRKCTEMGLPTRYSQFKAKSPISGRKEKRGKNDGRPPDTTKMLIFKKSKKRADKNKIPLSSSLCTSGGPQEHSNKYSGIQWNFAANGAYFSNTCSLDSVLFLLFVPHLMKANVTTYPDLADRKGLLHRSFALLNQEKHEEARLLWIREHLRRSVSEDLDLLNDKEIHGEVNTFFGYPNDRDNLFGNLRKEKRPHPLKSTIFLECESEEKCVATGGCGSGFPSTTKTTTTTTGDDDNDDDDHDDDVVFDGTVKYHKRTILSLVAGGRDYRNNRFSVTECLDHHLGGHLVQRCQNKKCEGPSWIGDACVSKWPHTLILDCAGIDISDLEPHVFIYRQKKFVLRGVILIGENHFTTVLKSPTHWVNCNGIGTKKFKFFPLQKGNYAQQGSKVCKAAFEVLDGEHSQEFHDECVLDWSTVLDGEHDEDKQEEESTTIMLSTKKNSRSRASSSSSSSSNSSSICSDAVVDLKSLIGTLKKHQECHNQTPNKKRRQQEVLSSEEDDAHTSSSGSKKKSRRMNQNKKKRNKQQTTLAHPPPPTKSLFLTPPPPRPPPPPSGSSSRSTSTATPKKMNKMKKRKYTTKEEEDIKKKEVGGSGTPEEQTSTFSPSFLDVKKNNKENKKNNKQETRSDFKRKRRKEEEEQEKPRCHSTRIPHGWSARPHTFSKKGRRPVCRGCMKIIEPTEKAVRHKFFQRFGADEYEKVNQFHCRPACMLHLSKEHIRQFIMKPWSDSQVQLVAENISKTMKQWS